MACFVRRRSVRACPVEGGRGRPAAAVPVPPRSRGPVLRGRHLVAFSRARVVGVNRGGDAADKKGTRCGESTEIWLKVRSAAIWLAHCVVGRSDDVGSGAAVLEPPGRRFRGMAIRGSSVMLMTERVNSITT